MAVVVVSSHGDDRRQGLLTPAAPNCAITGCVPSAGVLFRGIF